MKVVCMIPARLGSQRLKYKNLRKIGEYSLVQLAIRKALRAEVFDEIWVNSESEEIEKIALQEGVRFHKRPQNLADNITTSEEYVYEFLKKHECDYVVQLHTIAPLLTIEEIKKFENRLLSLKYDTFLSVEEIILECIYKNKPINFSVELKENSQDLTPIHKIAWSITAWKREVYIRSFENKKCATYSGRIGYFKLNKFSAHVIKTEEDLILANLIFKYFFRDEL